MPVALAATAGVALDRAIGLPLPVSLVVASAGLIAWAVALFGRRSGLAAVYLWITAAGLAAGYHSSYRNWYAGDDIGNAATPEPQPAHLRGILADEPAIHRQPPPDSLHTLPPGDTTIAVLDVTQMRRGDNWQTVSGHARLVVEGPLDRLHAGDEVDVVGRLQAPSPPGNPGEPDLASHLRDQRIRALMVVHKTTDGVARLAQAGPGRFAAGWLSCAGTVAARWKKRYPRGRSVAWPSPCSWATGPPCRKRTGIATSAPA